MLIERQSKDRREKLKSILCTYGLRKWIVDFYAFEENFEYAKNAENPGDRMCN
mgnify:CR=1 FL=1